METSQLGVIILAAGKGKRMKMDSGNKVVSRLAHKPMIVHIVDFMHSMHIKDIVVVIGHEKDSVIEALKDENVIFAEQTEQLGTGHAVQVALSYLPRHITDVLVVYGDDAVLYAKKHLPVINNLFSLHDTTHAAVTFLTIEQKNPYGLGRIVRDHTGKAISIVEEKDATDEQRKITEINPGCFIFSVDFLKKYLPKVKKSAVTGEVYVTTLIDLAFLHHEGVDTLQGKTMNWRGVNTPEELAQAEVLYAESQKP